MYVLISMTPQELFCLMLGGVLGYFMCVITFLIIFVYERGGEWTQEDIKYLLEGACRIHKEVHGEVEE